MKEYPSPLYQNIYLAIKNQIHCGIYRRGELLPSRAVLCREYGVSDKTIRRVVSMLSEEKLIETAQGRAPMVVYAASETDMQTLPDPGPTRKMFSLAILPVLLEGIKKASPEVLTKLEEIALGMRPEEEYEREFWMRTNRFWRFVLSQAGNVTAVRAYEQFNSAGMSQASQQTREEYQQELLRIARAIRAGTFHYTEEKAQVWIDRCHMVPVFVHLENSPVSLGRKGNLYKCIYMDIIDQILSGFYKKGDFLPSEAVLCETYSVSAITALRAVQELKKLGVVDSVSGYGMRLCVTPKEMAEKQVDRLEIAERVGNYLDSLQFVALTSGGLSRLAAENADGWEINRLEHDASIVYHAGNRRRFPLLLLDFIAEHLKMPPLEELYRMAEKELYLRRGVPWIQNEQRIQDTVTAICAASDVWRQESFAEKSEALFVRLYEEMRDLCQASEFGKLIAAARASQMFREVGL